MNTYVMSDVHGCYDEFQQMIGKIHFSNRDLLICAGDYIDRGTKNYEMMSWISNAPKNVVFVRGNHDEEFLANIRIMKYVCDEAELDENSIEDSITLYKAVQKFAEQNNNKFFDYYGTIGKLINEELVPFALLCDWAKIVERMPYFYKTDINKRNCIVVHAGYIESLDNVDTEENAKLACIRLEDEKIYYVGISDHAKSKELYLDGMMGLVTGDALGVPVEFSSREQMQEHPVVDMTGYGTYPVPAGSWSDDSSMALASLSALRSDGINLKKVMDNFVDWEENGKFTPAGEVFDEGATCSLAIYNYKQSGNVAVCGPAGENSNGNGSLMRILPVCIYLKYLQDECGLKDGTCLEIVHNMSALTHAHLRSKMSCGIYFYCVRELAKRKKPLGELLQNAVDLFFAFYEQNNNSKKELEHFSRIRNMEKLRKIPAEQINSGGYVIESIEAALWCLLNTSDFKDCVLKAVNLGHDTDTTAAIAGGLAGIYYGYKSIPERWLKIIIRREWIEDLCRTI